MKNRWLLNVALALIIAALVLVVIFRPGKPSAPATTPLTALSLESVQHLRLQRPRQPDIALERTNGLWRLTAPRLARANEYRAAEIARMAIAPVQTQFTARPDDLAQYGLDKPTATVFLNEQEIRFGTLHPLNNAVYVLLDGKVHLIPAAQLRNALSTLEDLLSPALLDEKTKILAFQFPGFSLKQDAQGAWARTPAIKELGTDRINQFVDEWRYARALVVAPYSGQPQKERIIVTIAADKPRNIEFGVVARKPELVLVRNDEKLEYHFAEDVGTRLLDLKPEAEPVNKSAAASPAKP